MLECKKCPALESEVAFLRGRLAKQDDRIQLLTERLVSVTAPESITLLQSPKPFDPSQYYGNEHDELIEFDEFGQKVIRVKGQEVDERAVL